MSPIKNEKTAQETATDSSKETSKIEKGGVCKEIKSPLTAKQLRDLRHEIEQGKISKKAEEYNFPETKLEKSDTLASILEKVFTQKGVKAPKGGIERIELALTANGLDLEKIKADSWKVEKGRLIFINSKGKSPVDVFTINLLPWTALDAKEGKETLTEHYYDLGVYRGAPVMENPPEMIEGGVDATPHGLNVKQAKWYEEKVHATALLLKIYDNNKNRFDSPTQSLIAGHEKILRDLASQTNYSPAKMRTDFEKKYTKEEISGGDGVYNFVLAFQRVLDAYGKEDKRLTKPDAATVVSLIVGKTLRKREERFVKTVRKAEGDGNDLPPVICDPGDEENPPPKPPPIPPKKPEDDTYRDRSAKDKEHLAVTTDEGKLLPSSAQFKENIDVDAASSALLESYSKTGTKALVEGLKAIPDNQKQVVLDSIFKKLGEKDPEKAFQLMKDIVKEEKGLQEDAVLAGLKENMDKAPDQNQKDFWKIQMLLFETSQAGDINAATGLQRLTMEQSQGKMREIVDLVSKVDEVKLPAELQEMFKQQKQYFETSLRQGIAGDYVETAIMTVESMMKNKTDKDTYIETSFESLKKKSRADIKTDLNKWYGLDNDSEVYMSSMHVLEALRLAVTYKYPQDVAAGKKIENPIEHYFNEIKNGTLTEIILPPGTTAQMKDILLDQPLSASGKIDLNQLFVDKTKEFDLFGQYQKGQEQLGEDSFWNSIQEYKEGIVGNNKNAAKIGSYVSMVPPFCLVLGGLSAVAAISQVASDERTSFMEKKGGLVEGSKMFFPKAGDLSAFMKDVPGGKGEDIDKLGATEKLQMYKILQLISMKHYDEARSLCIQALEQKMATKKKLAPNDIKDKALELQKEYGEKIAAQVRIQLEAQKITNAVLQQKQIPRPGGGVYTDLIDYINDRVKGAIDEMAYIRLQGEISNSFSSAEVAGFSQYEKAAYDQLQIMNGHKADTAWLTIEHANTVKDVAVMVAEIIIIELVTLGAGTYFAGAAGVAEGAGLAARAGTTAVRMGEVGTNVSRGSRIAVAINEAGQTGALAARIGRGATGVGGFAGRGIRYVAEGETIPARMLGTYMHGASFVEMQSLLRGRPVNPASLDGQMQIATAALTMYGLGKLQQFTRGATAGARMAETGTLTGWRGLPGVRNINTLSNRLGNIAGALDRGALAGSTGAKIGSKAFTAGEIGLEITALQGLGEVEQQLAVWSGTMTDDERKAMKDPDAFNRWAHTAGVVLGLRTWRGVKSKIIQTPPQLPEGPKPPKQLPRGMEVERLNSLVKETGAKNPDDILPPEKINDFKLQLDKAKQYLEQPGQDEAYAFGVIRNAFDIPKDEPLSRAKIMEIKDKLLGKLPENETNKDLREKINAVAEQAAKVVDNVAPETKRLMEEYKETVDKGGDLRKMAKNIGAMTARIEKGLLSDSEILQYVRMVLEIDPGLSITAQNYYEITRARVSANSNDFTKSGKEAAVTDAANRLIDVSGRALKYSPALEASSTKPGIPESAELRRFNLNGRELIQKSLEEKNRVADKLLEILVSMKNGKLSKGEVETLMKDLYRIPAGEQLTEKSLESLTTPSEEYAAAVKNAEFTVDEAAQRNALRKISSAAENIRVEAGKILFPEAGKPVVTGAAPEALKITTRKMLGDELRDVKVEEMDASRRDAIVKAIETLKGKVNENTFSKKDLQNKVLKEVFQIEDGKTISSAELPRLARKTLGKFSPDVNKGKEEICTPIFRALTELISTSKNKI